MKYYCIISSGHCTPVSSEEEWRAQMAGSRIAWSLLIGAEDGQIYRKYHGENQMFFIVRKTEQDLNGAAI